MEQLRLKNTLLEDLWKVVKLNDSLLFQKLRDRCIKEGESNTKYIHNIVNWRRRVNALRGLLIEGNWEEDPFQIKNEVKTYFDDIFISRPDSGLSLDGVPFHMISRVEKASLVANFDLEEIRAMVWDCEGDSIPGPDGFNFWFLKVVWHDMKMDIKKVVDDFHRNGCMYKIVAKLLANRLRGVMDHIDINQSAFIGGRQMMDSVLVANEVIDEEKTRKRTCLIFKVDFEKANDSVN
ncbi:uncharacterized protein LOC130727526 [Lotus japonicus]|uniref:uncharacterized protein LOC130727526 n=1 Tax=Lotus japonicus TaxID=34305 RepID=UPI002587067B|nr:uncharacterized protein LOC130727526 [Lotus japonicus]